MATHTMLRHRPVCVLDDEVRSLFLSYVWRAIKFDEVRLIERRMISSGVVGQPEERLRIIGTHSSIVIHSYIEGFEELKHTLATIAQSRGIEVKFLDMAGRQIGSDLE